MIKNIERLTLLRIGKILTRCKKYTRSPFVLDFPINDKTIITWTLISCCKPPFEIAHAWMTPAVLMIVKYQVRTSSHGLKECWLTPKCAWLNFHKLIRKRFTLLAGCVVCVLLFCLEKPCVNMLSFNWDCVPVISCLVTAMIYTLLSAIKWPLHAWSVERYLRLIRVTMRRPTSDCRGWMRCVTCLCDTFSSLSFIEKNSFGKGLSPQQPQFTSKWNGWLFFNPLT